MNATVILIRGIHTTSQRLSGGGGGYKEIRDLGYSPKYKGGFGTIMAKRVNKRDWFHSDTNIFYGATVLAYLWWWKIERRARERDRDSLERFKYKDEYNRKLDEYEDMYYKQLVAQGANVQRTE